MKIFFSFDDATSQDLLIAELLEKYNFQKNSVFYFPVMPNVVNNPKGRQSLTEKEMQDIASKFEIGSHTITHQLLTRISLNQAKTEIFDSRKILQEKFKQPINKFSYPRGYANAELQIAVQEAGYESARSTLVGYIHESENNFFEQTTVHVGCDRKEYGGMTWLDYAIKMLEVANNTDESIYHAWGHGFELANYDNGFKQFESLLKRLSEI